MRKSRMKRTAALFLISIAVLTGEDLLTEGFTVPVHNADELEDVPWLLEEDDAHLEDPQPIEEVHSEEEDLMSMDYMEYASCILGPPKVLLAVVSQDTNFIDDIIFTHFCRDVPEMIVCNRTFPASSSTYSDVVLRTIHSGIEMALDYVCYNDGERLVRVVEEGGLECVNRRRDALAECMLQAAVVLQSLHGKAAQAWEDLDRVTATWERCLVDALQTCPSQSPANFVESLYLHVTGSPAWTADAIDYQKNI